MSTRKTTLPAALFVAVMLLLVWLWRALLGVSLVATARRGHGAQVESLLRQGADPNAIGYLGWRPLHEAAWSGDESVVTLLLDRGADVNGRDYLSGMPPLFLAAARGRTGVVRPLVARGAQVDATDDGGRTALILAAGANPQDAPGAALCVKILLSHGVDPRVRDHAGGTALELARQRANRPIISLLERAGVRE